MMAVFLIFKYSCIIFKTAGIATGTGAAYKPTGVGGTSQVSGILNRAAGDKGNLAGSALGNIPILT